MADEILLPQKQQERSDFFRLYSKLMMLDPEAAARAVKNAGIDVAALEVQVTTLAKEEYFNF